MQIDAFEFWRRADNLLSKKSMTLGDLSTQATLSYSTINSQRTRHSLPKVEQLLSMARALGVSMEYLLTGEGEVLCAEAQAVQDDPELRALVRAISRDRRLLAAISAVVESYESKADIG